MGLDVKAKPLMLGLGCCCVFVAATGCFPGRGERVEPWSTLQGLTPPQPDVTADHGDGSSYQAAFTVHTTSAEAPRAEELWIFGECERNFDGGRIVTRGGTLTRSRGSLDHRSYDVVTLTRTNGTTSVFYFDLSHIGLEAPGNHDR